MESVLELDFTRVNATGAPASNDPASVAEYWLEKALDESRENYFTFPPTPVDENSLKFRLREELRPLLDIRQRISAASSKEETAALYQQYQAAKADYALAERVFQLMGPEKCQSEMLYSMAQHLEFMREKRRTEWSQLTSDFNHEPFAKMLKLNNDQKTEANDDIEKASGEFRRLIGKLLRDLSDASMDRWKRLIGLLNSEQREFAESRVGKPVEWHRNFRSPGMKNGFYLHYVAAHEENQSEERESIGQDDMQNPKSEGTMVIELLVYRLLGEKVIWDELELVEDQKKKLKLLAHGMFGAKNLLVRPKPRTRFNGLIEGTTKIPKEVEEMLLPDQLEWFRQIEFQFRTEPKYDSTVGLLDPRVVKHLKLSDEQQSEMKFIGDEFAETLRTTTEKINAVKKRIEDDLESKLTDLLDEEQLASYRKFTKPTAATDRSK